MSPPQQSHSLLASLQRFFSRSHAGDYLGLTLLAVGYLLIQLLVEPFHRLFSLDNHAIQFPHAEVERVPLSYLFLYALGLPLLSLALYFALTCPPAHKIHVSVLGLVVALLLTSFLTDVFKNAVGRPRPDLLARCKPAQGTPRNKLVGVDVCTETKPHLLQDGWRSFPSGHSSFAFAGLGYLAMFIAGQLHIFRPRVDLARALLAMAPLVGATMIAISRCEDYRHDVYDVTVGSLLGLLIAHFIYRKYYPPLRATNCDEAHSEQSEAARRNGYGKLRDEEAADSPYTPTQRGRSNSDRLPLRDRSEEPSRS